MVELINHLNAIHPLSAEAIAALLKVMKAKELRRGQVWLQEGAVCDKITFVVKGLLKLYFESGTKELIVQFARENEWMISAQSYFDGTTSHYSIRSVEPSVVISITQKELQYLLDHYMDLSKHFSAIANLQITSLEKHTALLMLPPKERFDKLLKIDSWVIDGRRITDKLLAAYLGVRTTTVCEWRKESKRL